MGVQTGRGDLRDREGVAHRTDGDHLVTVKPVQLRSEGLLAQKNREDRDYLDTVPF